MVVSEPIICKRSGTVRIDTADGHPFYFMKGEGTFTLPVGRYVLRSGRVAKVGPMPPRPFTPGEPMHPVPARFTVKVADNPAKASIHLASGRILLDRSIADAPPFIRAYVIAHEIGHYWHDDEKGADRYAAEFLYHLGYNPSQIDAAARLALSDCAQSRKDALNTFAHGFER